MEHENRLETADPLDQGNIYRAYLRITSIFTLFPESQNLRDKFEINIDWQFRYNLDENVESLEVKEHRYFSASFNYVIFSADDGKRTAKIGLDYVNGDNPSKNFEEQSFYAVSLKIKL